MDERQDFFRPIRKRCVHEDACVSFPQKCIECEFNPNKKELRQENVSKMQEMAKQYKGLPDEFKLF
jgi:hypothetical protein